MLVAERIYVIPTLLYPLPPREMGLADVMWMASRQGGCEVCIFQAWSMRVSHSPLPSHFDLGDHVGKCQCHK